MSSLSQPRILFLVAHPHLEKSRANRAVVDAVSGLEGVTLHKIYDRYPYFHIDVEREQQLLLEHDIFVMQHPFYWYSMPALLKLWLDEVLESGFAYGPGGDKLSGKKFLLSLTIGGPQSSYCAESYNKCSVEALLGPWKQTVDLCQMEWLEPLVVYGSIAADADHLRGHGRRVRETLETLFERGGHA